MSDTRDIKTRSNVQKRNHNREIENLYGMAKPEGEARSGQGHFHLSLFFK